MNSRVNWLRIRYSIKWLILNPTSFVLLVATPGLFIAFQGWKSKIPDFDLLPFIDDARQFASLGQIPEKGILTSFASYTPPGTTWLMLPGTYLLSDPRLFESIGSGALYIGTLIGIFLLARTYFGIKCAYLAVAVWSLSEIGLFFAHSLWPRGHPFFYVWMVYWTAQWVRRKDSVYLTAAVVTWALGMYVFMEIVPALFIVPVVWFIFRPPLRLWPLFLAGIVIAVIWYPYIHFEVSRGFADLKSQVLRQKIWPTNFEDFWCNPALAPKSWNVYVLSNAEAEGATVSPHNFWRTYLGPFVERAYVIVDQLLIANFHHTAKIPGTALALLLLTLLSILVLSVNGSQSQRYWDLTSQARSLGALKWFGISTAVTGVLINERTARYLSRDGILEPSTISTIRGWQAILIVSGLLVLILRRAIAARLHYLARNLDSQSVRDSEKSGLVAVSLIVPWLILLFIAEADRPERFWWLWPLQVIILAAGVAYWPLRLGLPRRFSGIFSFVLFLVVAGNSLLLGQLDGWIRNGWSGSDAEEIKVVDYTAGLIRSEGKDHTAIGYYTYMVPFMAIFNGADHRYKVGATFDLLFKYRHGIINTDGCAEGISSNDEYRIVETDRNAGIATTSPYRRIDAPLDPRFHMLAKIGPYQIFKRD